MVNNNEGNPQPMIPKKKNFLIGGASATANKKGEVPTLIGLGSVFPPNKGHKGTPTPAEADAKTLVSDKEAGAKIAEVQSADGQVSSGPIKRGPVFDHEVRH